MPANPQKFRKKPVEIEAVQWTGSNEDEIRGFVGEAVSFQDAIAFDEYIDGTPGTRALIRTLEGTMSAEAGDWIIRGVKGEFYPCKPDIFEATYDSTDPEAIS
jgi:hypothetical protein